MKEIICEVGLADLKKALRTVAPVVSPNPVKPATEFAHFTINKGKMMVKATDVHTTIKTSCPIISVNTEERCEFMMPHNQTTKLLAVLPDAPITIVTIYKNGKYPSEDVFLLKLKSGSDEYKMDMLNPSEFPQAPAHGASSPFVVNGGALYHAITACNITTDKTINPMNPAFAGIHFDSQDGKLRITSCHNNSFTRVVLNDALPEDFIPFTLRHDTASILADFSNSDVAVQLSHSGNQIALATSSVALTCLEMPITKYPDITPILKYEYPVNVVINDCQALVIALKRASVINPNASKTVTKAIVKDGIMVVETIDGATKEITSSQSISVESTEDITFGLNAGIISPILQKQNGAVTFKMMNDVTTFLIEFEQDKTILAGSTPVKLFW